MTKKVLLAIFLLAFLIIGVNSYERKADDKLLQADHELTYGYIIFKRYGTSPWGNNSGSIKYRFTSKNKKYEGKFDKDKFCNRWNYKNRLNIQKYHYPIVYQASKPEVSRIVLTEDDYLKYSVPMTGLLNCVRIKYFDCEMISDDHLELLLNECNAVL